MKSCDLIVHEKAHKSIIPTIRKEIKNLFEFESSNVFLYDPLSKFLYLINIDHDIFTMTVSENEKT